MDAFDQDAFTMRTQNADLSAKVKQYELELPKAVDAKRMMEDHRMQTLGENTQLKGTLEGLRAMQARYEEEAKAQKVNIDRLMDKCHALQAQILNSALYCAFI